MAALGSIMGANAVISIRFAPIGHSIGCITELIALIVPAIAAVRGRIVVMLDRIARLTCGCGEWRRRYRWKAM